MPVHAQVCVFGYTCVCVHVCMCTRRTARGREVSLAIHCRLHLQGPAGAPGPEGRQGEKGAKVRERPPWMPEHPFHLPTPLVLTLQPPNASPTSTISTPSPLWGQGSLYLSLPQGSLGFDPSSLPHPHPPWAPCPQPHPPLCPSGHFFGCVSGGSWCCGRPGKDRPCGSCRPSRKTWP